MKANFEPMNVFGNCLQLGAKAANLSTARNLRRAYFDANALSRPFHALPRARLYDLPLHHIEANDIVHSGSDNSRSGSRPVF